MFFDRIIQLVKKIPVRKVVTYGQIAAMAGSPRAARLVGWVLHNLNDDRLKSIPWHRVINREGRISTTCLDHPAQEQAWLLKKERVQVEYRDGNYFVDLKKYLWSPRRRFPY